MEDAVIKEVAEEESGEEGGRRLAVVCNPAKMHQVTQPSACIASGERFSREIRTGAQLGQGHDVQYHDH